MSEQEFNEKYGCLGKSIDDLPPDAIEEIDGKIFIVEELIPKGF